MGLHPSQTRNGGRSASCRRSFASAQRKPGGRCRRQRTSTRHRPLSHDSILGPPWRRQSHDQRRHNARRAQRARQRVGTTEHHPTSCCWHQTETTSQPTLSNGTTTGPSPPRNAPEANVQPSTQPPGHPEHMMAPGPSGSRQPMARTSPHILRLPQPHCRHHHRPTSVDSDLVPHSAPGPRSARGLYPNTHGRVVVHQRKCG